MVTFVDPIWFNVFQKLLSDLLGSLRWSQANNFFPRNYHHKRRNYNDCPWDNLWSRRRYLLHFYLRYLTVKDLFWDIQKIEQSKWCFFGGTQRFNFFPNKARIGVYRTLKSCISETFWAINMFESALERLASSAYFWYPSAPILETAFPEQCRAFRSNFIPN